LPLPSSFSLPPPSRLFVLLLCPSRSDMLPRSTYALPRPPSLSLSVCAGQVCRAADLCRRADGSHALQPRRPGPFTLPREFRAIFQHVLVGIVNPRTISARVLDANPRCLARCDWPRPPCGSTPFWSQFLCRPKDFPFIAGSWFLVQIINEARRSSFAAIATTRCYG